MKNINTYILIVIVSLVMVVAAFLMTAADEPVRQAGMYLPIIFGAVATWAAAKASFLEMDCEDRKAQRSARTA